MKVDRAATEVAKQRQAEGFDRLKAYFQWTPASAPGTAQNGWNAKTTWKRRKESGYAR